MDKEIMQNNINEEVQAEDVNNEETLEENIEAEETDNAEEENKTEESNETPIQENQALTILEGLLFVVGDEGITLEQASEVLGISQEDCENAFKELMDIYSDDSHGFEVVDYGKKYKFLTKGIIHPYAQRLFQDAKEQKLSQSALETLAIIAYKQPITRVEIEEIRGIGCDMMLRKLQARNLIQEIGRSEAPGRPILYEVTDEFMDSFKLLSLNELPELTDFSDNENEEESDDLFEQ